MYCTSYAELYDVPCTILRFGIPYGPRARPAAVIPIFVSKALKGEPLTIAGDGLQTRRFVYVEDLAEGVVAGLQHGGGEPRLQPRGRRDGDDPRARRDVVSELIDDIEIVHTPGRNGDFGGAVISNERAAEELGWRASTPLREGVRRYLAWLEPERAPAPSRSPSPRPSPSRRRGRRRSRRSPSSRAWPSTSASILAQRLDRGPRLRRRDADPLSPRLQVRRLRHRAGRLRGDHLPDRHPRGAQPAAARRRRRPPGQGRRDRGLADRRLRRARDPALDHATSSISGCRTGARSCSAPWASASRWWWRPRRPAGVDDEDTAADTVS